MEWSNITITSMETKYEGAPGRLLLKAVDKTATLFFDKNDYKGAIKAAKKILWFAKTDFDNFYGHFFITMSLERMNDIDKAASEASEALKYCDNFYGSNSNMLWCHNFLANYYRSKKMYEKAMEVLEKGRRFAGTDSDQYCYYINMSALYKGCDDSQNAFKMEQSALQYAKSDAEIAHCYLDMAMLEYDLSESDLEGHGQDAIKYSRIGLKYVERIFTDSQGENLSYWRAMAYFCYRMRCTIYEELEEKDKAIEEANHALEYTDGNREREKELYQIIVRCDIGRNDVNTTKNLRILLRYYDTQKEKFNICYELVKEYTKCGDVENAFKIVQCALQYAETDVEFAVCYGEMSLCQWELGVPAQEAMESVKNYLDYVGKITPKNQDENLYWRRLTLACYTVLSYGYEKIGEKDKAIEEANHALQYTDGDREDEKEMYKIIARCYEDREDGSAIKSLQILLRYCNTDEEKARVHNRLAGQYMDINDWEKAREEDAVAVKLNPLREYIVELLELYHIDENIQACKDLILKYGVHKDEPGITKYIKNDPELKKHLK